MRNSSSRIRSWNRHFGEPTNATHHETGPSTTFYPYGQPHTENRENRRRSTCGFLFAILNVVADALPNVVDGPVSWRTGKTNERQDNNHRFFILPTPLVRSSLELLRASALRGPSLPQTDRRSACERSLRYGRPQSPHPDASEERRRVPCSPRSVCRP